MTETDIAWAAGFFDGEGCIVIRKYLQKNRKVPSYYVEIQISQREREPLERFMKWFGGTINTKTNGTYNGRKYYYWRVMGIRALETLDIIYPFLYGKKSQANVVMNEFRPWIWHTKGRSNRPQENSEHLDKAYHKLLQIRKEMSFYAQA